jgi:hypothetical protein
MTKIAPKINLDKSSELRIKCLPIKFGTLNMQTVQQSYRKNLNMKGWWWQALTGGCADGTASA